ncbi:MAG: hypothetical protein M3O46_18425, partial [Myxococcota bacterium]|nr:hypothetical protein [Myxococcota bacterium]
MNRIAPILRGRCLIVLIAILAFLGVGCGGPDFSVNSLDATDMGDGGREALPPLLCPHCQDPGSTTGADVGADATIDGGGSNDATAPADAGVDPSMDASMDETRSRDSGSSQLIPCTAGGACPVSDCQNGTWACTDAGRVCQPTTIVTPGTPCGTAGAASQVCSSTGACVACNAGGDCADALMPCVKKSYDCTSGAAVCRATGNVADGVSCGTGLNCNGGGCTACKVGAACPPAANPCHAGKITACTGGVATCTDQMTSAAAGTACTAAGGGSGVCDG